MGQDIQRHIERLLIVVGHQYGDLALTRIYECDLSFGRADEDGISLTNVDEGDADWLTGLTLGGNAIAGED
jgi:hypothetical protein